jgi:hypothetical protein
VITWQALNNQGETLQHNKEPNIMKSTDIGKNNHSDSERRKAMQKRLWFGALALGFVVTSLAFRQFQPVAAFSPELSAANKARQAVTDASDSGSVSASRPGFADGQEAIHRTIQTLATTWSDAVLASNGWLHVTTHHTRDKDKVSILPNGQTIPLNYVSDTWYRLEQGQVVEVIAFMRAEDGEPVQISTFRDNTWRNLTVGEKWGGEPFAPRLDLGFSADAAQAQAWGSILSRQPMTLAGKTALRFTLRDEFASPVQLEGYAQPATSAERHAYFDPQSGALLLLERVLVMADGKERVVERVDQITIQQGAEPPAEVLAVLQQEVTK